jgi:hypothetical protein
MQPFPFARKEPVNITDAIPLLSRIVRHYLGGSLIEPDEHPCWKCGYWLFAAECGTPYCVYCGHTHRPPTPVYRPAVFLGFWTEEGTLTVV